MGTKGRRSSDRQADHGTDQPPGLSEAKFATVFRVCPDFITITDRVSGRYFDVNEAFARITGYDKSEVIGRTSADIGVWESGAERNRVLDALATSPRLENFEVRFRRKTGEIIDALISVERAILGGDDCLIIVGRDISDRKRVAKALEDSETRFRLAMEASNDGLWDWDIGSDITYFSPAYFRMLGYEPGELTMTGGTWLNLIHPDDRHTAQQANQDCIDHKCDNFAVEFRMQAKDGSWKWILGRGRAFWRGPDGKALRMIGTHVDITERKDAELRINSINKKMAEQAERLERTNANLEQFAYVASHDIREPLRMINSYVMLLERRYDALFDDDAREFLRFAREGAQRMDRMVLDLLEFSRIGRFGDPFTSVPMAEVIGTAIDALRMAISENEAEIVFCGEMPSVRGVAGELIRLMQNLIDNALKYRHPERSPLIRIFCHSHHDGWTFAVSDNGIGIGQAYFERIFAIFQRLHTRDKFHGTGIGLAICKKIVEDHGGRIWVESTVGEGTTFYFTLHDGSASF